jgi:hypothetical protein
MANTNTSATGGPLIPAVTPAVMNDQELENFFQAWLVGLTGYDPKMVRPSWQVQPANIPDNDIDWMAFRISVSAADTFVANLQFAGPPSYNQLRRHQVLTLRFFFYGPNASSFADLLRDGGGIPQNSEVLQLNNMGIIGFGDQVSAPELVKNLWYRRVDMELQVKRQIVRNYPVLDLVSAETSLNNELYVTDISVQPPSP